MDWEFLTLILTVVGSVGASVMWLDSRIEKAIDKLEVKWEKQRHEDQKRWQWLFDWAHYEVNDLKSRHGKV